MKTKRSYYIILSEGNRTFFFLRNEKKYPLSQITLIKGVKLAGIEKQIELVHICGTQKKFKKLQHAIEWQENWLKIKFSNPYK